MHVCAYRGERVSKGYVTQVQGTRDEKPRSIPGYTLVRHHLRAPLSSLVSPPLLWQEEDYWGILKGR